MDIWPIYPDDDIFGPPNYPGMPGTGRGAMGAPTGMPGTGGDSGGVTIDVNGNTGTATPGFNGFGSGATPSSGGGGSSPGPARHGSDPASTPGTAAYFVAQVKAMLAAFAAKNLAAEVAMMSSTAPRYVKPAWEYWQNPASNSPSVHRAGLASPEVGNYMVSPEGAGPHLFYHYYDDMGSGQNLDWFLNNRNLGTLGNNQGSNVPSPFRDINQWSDIAPGHETGTTLESLRYFLANPPPRDFVPQGFEEEEQWREFLNIP